METSTQCSLKIAVFTAIWTGHMKRDCKQFAERGKKNQVQFEEWYKKNPKRKNELQTNPK